MFLGESNVMKGLTLAAAVGTTAIAFSANAGRVVTSVYQNESGQAVRDDVTSFEVSDNGDGTFLFSLSNDSFSTRTDLNAVYFEGGLSSLTTGFTNVAVGGTDIGQYQQPAVINQIGGEVAQADVLSWDPSVLGFGAPSFGEGLSNGESLDVTFAYAPGVTFSDVESLLGGFGFRVATLVLDINDVAFWSASGSSSSDAISGDGNVSSVPTPSAFAAGLGLLGLAGLKRRRDEA